MSLRLRIWVLTVLVAFDQLAHIMLAGPKYLIVGGPIPDPDETISGKVGRMAIQGKRWALISEWIIDRLAWCFTRRMGHCRRAAAREEARKINA